MIRTRKNEENGEMGEEKRRGKKETGIVTGQKEEEKKNNANSGSEMVLASLVSGGTSCSSSSSPVFFLFREIGVAGARDSRGAGCGERLGLYLGVLDTGMMQEGGRCAGGAAVG